jgi:hypothetical protein
MLPQALVVERRLLRIHFPSQDDASKGGGLLLTLPGGIQTSKLNDLQTAQGQLLNNFVSGSIGGFVGTVLNTPYVPYTSHSSHRIANIHATSTTRFDVSG